MNIHSHTCPTLTLVDLPGLTKVKINNQAEDTPQKTFNMSKTYISDPKTIILAVAPANADLATSDGLALALEVDPQKKRTIGVLTKVDLMDRGTNAQKILENKQVPLRLGYFGVKNRS